MVRERDPSKSSGPVLSPQKREFSRQPLANISAKMQSPSQNHHPNENDDALNVIEFGKASPLRNPLHGPKRPSPSGVFIPKSRPQHSIRPATAPRHLPAFSDDDSPPASRLSVTYPSLPGSAVAKNSDATEIQRPTNVSLTTVQPSRPTFSSVNSGATYKPLKPLSREKSSSLVTQHSTTAGEEDEERFDPDAAIRAESGRFGVQDPYDYVDSNKANENIKDLLESAFDDNEGKGRIRLRNRIQKGKKEDGSKSFADKLAALSVEDKETAKEDQGGEEDGTVEGLAVKLLPHQVEGVSWMIDKEIGMKKTKGVLPHGGILADDMGLGKTVQSVALFVTNPRPAVDAKPEHPKQKMPRKSVGKSTLVVAPLALIKQWESEIQTKVAKDHSLKVLVHHGPSRTKSAEKLSKYDVVITTYQTLTSEHAGSNMTVEGCARIGCMGVYWYRVVLDEAHSIKNRNAKSSQACFALNSWYRWCLTGTPMQNNLDELQSLIKFLRIKPYCDLPTWKDQIVQPMKSGRGGLAMRRLQYFLRAFMKRRTKDILKQEGALNFGGSSDKDGASSGGMQIVKREIVNVECDLDEPERRFYDRLQDRADKRLEDIMDGKQKVDYMTALVLLLRLRQACNHPQLVERAVSQDKDAMTTGFPSTQNSMKLGDGYDMDSLTALMGGVTMQSTACDVCQVDMSPAEAKRGLARCSDCETDLAAVNESKKHDAHERDPKKTKAEARSSRGKAESRRARGRKIVNDSDDEQDEAGVKTHVPSRRDVRRADSDDPDDEDAEGGGETLATIDSERSTDDDSEMEDSPARARMRDRTSTRHLRTESLEEDDDDDDDEEEEASKVSDGETDSDSALLDGIAPSGKSGLAPSTKIRHLLRILHRESPEHKTIVFSQFTTMLDLIAPHLQNSRVRYVRYHGSMKPDEREASLHSLRHDPKTRVLLCSLKCGSLGLNLTAASRVVIIEPFWNPFVEEQAIDRVHRLNQTVDVKVFRLTVRDSVEERILALQERKRGLVRAAIGGAAAGNATAKLTMQDILSLFRRDAEHTAHDEEDRALWEEFGGDNRLFEGTQPQRDGTSIPRHATAAKPRKLYQEHDVYGRRW